MNYQTKFLEEYKYKPGKPLTGFFHTSYQKKLYPHRFVAIPSSILSSVVENAFDGSGINFHTDNIENSYLIFALFSGTIKPTGYSINPRIDGDAISLFQMQSFKFEGSVDGSNWIELDSQKENSSFCKTTDVYYKQISTSQKFQKFRIVQTGVRCDGNLHNMNFVGIDVYGKYEYTPLSRGCNRNLLNGLSSLFLFIT